MGTGMPAALRPGWLLLLAVLPLGCATGTLVPEATARRAYDGPYAGEHLERIAFPLGGLGAGMICLEGTGAISHVSVRNRMEAFHEPCAFAALCVKGPEGNTARVLEGPVPRRKFFGAPDTGNGAGGTSFGLPRFDRARFLARFPFATIDLADAEIPLEVEITGWSPFAPGDADASSLPCAALEYRFRNRTAREVEAVFSYHAKQFMATGEGGDAILPIEGGFVLSQEGSAEHPENRGAYAVFAAGEEAVVDHCWFRGGWWDALTLAWRNVEEGRLLANPPAADPAPGASLYVPFAVAPGEERTVRLLLAWYVPETSFRYGRDDPAALAGRAFAGGPSRGTAPGQQAVAGFHGAGLVNTYDPSGDGATGVLRSPAFVLERPYLEFLIGGGSHAGRTCLELRVGDEVVRTAAGQDREELAWTSWDVRDLAGREAVLRIVDEEPGPWGHVNVDLIVAADEDHASLADLLAASAESWAVWNDFEGDDFGGWTVEGAPAPAEAGPESCCPGGVCESPNYVPWYAGRFRSLETVAAHWRHAYDDLRRRSSRFRAAFYDTTLPAEVIEAVAANLTILKSPTVLRQCDGRLWAFEGCDDDSGCCAGSCTHVWNYAQAIPHLFPALERTLRETEFRESQDDSGHQTFRSALPIRPVAHTFHAAADGQLGGIMKMHREWRIAGDTGWLAEMWPRVRQSLEYCIATWDPREVGALEEPHHNTYDIEYWGPDGHCTSFYLGALAAASEMGAALGEDVSRYRSLAAKGREYLETRLYNGEYFFQEVRTAGLNAEFAPLDESGSGPGYAGIVAAVNEQGPKYQYGTGCLSDGVLGFWIARMCGLDADLADPAKVRRNLRAIYEYNLRHDLSSHANPQRPSYALGAEGGLLLCTWPRGGELAIPFVYSDEVWTGIEYQVASHLFLAGLVEEGLDIVRTCRDRYDGRVRNPFDEYECGHWYARALSSYGLLQGLTGARYDAVERTLHIDSRVGDFRSFLATATGYGTVGLRGGLPFLEVVEGRIDVERVLVAGVEMAL
ncbi:MAG: GH116 family glycosyl hydrolase [Planctomycetota bacterium]